MELFSEFNGFICFFNLYFNKEFLHKIISRENKIKSIEKTLEIIKEKRKTYRK